MNICVFGAASNEIDKTYIEAVEAFGEEMAKRGHTLVFGAGGGGLMGAVARGVHRGGGKITGIIPSFFRDETIEAIFDKCDELIFTDTMAERKNKMEDLAEAFVTVPGGIGTFEEFFQVLTLKQLARHTKPIAIFDVNNYYSELNDFLNLSVREKFINQDCYDLYLYTSNACEILDYVENDERVKKDVHELKLG